ncbi:hypothetical protein CLAIMM_14565 [Cladophialophora immunda]|nr:hypothetical protein CLAIMM_14565 [Cladophialophora immunda]
MAESRNSVLSNGTSQQHGKRSVRIAGASGGSLDRFDSIARLAQDPELDAIVGDWMSENVMTVQGAAKKKALATLADTSTSQTLDEKLQLAQFAPQFSHSFTLALPNLAKNRIKLAVNAGGCDTELLALLCDRQVREGGYNLKVAWVEGDDVFDAFQELRAGGEKFQSIIDGKSLDEWGYDPVAAQCYMGSMGIAEALRNGADIVICGRVADAAPCMGVASWWHEWNTGDLDQLAGALIAGHLIECSTFVTGGYYSRFKDLMKRKQHVNLGLPIVEVDASGDCVITKQKSTGGCVNTETVISQLLYEISGPYYYNSDAVAHLENIKVKQLAEDRVLVTGITGGAPPPTTRLGVTAHGGYQAEFHFTLCGLDIEEKTQMMEDQIRASMGEEMISRFSMLKFHRHGTCPDNPPTQEFGTVDFRIFAQCSDAKIFDLVSPKGFNRRILETVLQSVPGVARSNDTRQAAAKPYFEYFVTLISQSVIKHRVHCLFDDEKIIDIPSPQKTEPYRKQQPSYETSNPAALDSFGPTQPAPLGYVALGRSGDKAADANVGFFVTRDDEWDWLRTVLTVDKVKELLGPADYTGHGIDRFEMPDVKAVHFFLHDHLDRGYNSTSRLDSLGKNVGEYLRSKWLDVPKRFLERGRP